MEERIKKIYNGCWHNYKLYLSDHDMKAYNERSGELFEQFGEQTDIQNLLLWFAPVVNKIHEQYLQAGGRR